MYGKLFTFLLIALVVSCKEVSFKESQPKGKRVLKEVPQKLHGKYVPYDDGMEADTLVINSKVIALTITTATSRILCGRKHF